MGHQPGVINHYVDPAISRNRGLHQMLDLFTLSDVGLRGDRFAFAARQLLGQGLNPIHPPSTQYQDGTLPRKVACCRLAKPAARASDDNNFAFNVITHSDLQMVEIAFKNLSLPYLQ